MRQLLILLLAAIPFLGACTPDQAVWVHFYANGDRTTYEQAKRVAGCESGNGGDFATVNPGAVSPTNDHGLFQINIIHRRSFERVTGQPWHKVYDPFWNTTFAKWLYDQQGWEPWTCRKAL